MYRPLDDLLHTTEEVAPFAGKCVLANWQNREVGREVRALTNRKR